MNLEWRKWRIKLKAHYKNFSRGCSDQINSLLFLGQIFPDEGHFLSRRSQIQLTHSLIGYFRGCLLDASSLLNQRDDEWEGTGSLLFLSVCVCFIPVAQCLTDRKSFLLTYQNSLCHLSRNKFSPAVRGCQWLSLDLSPLSFFVLVAQTSLWKKHLELFKLQTVSKLWDLVGVVNRSSNIIEKLHFFNL